jgi:hypothetical protein
MKEKESKRNALALNSSLVLLHFLVAASSPLVVAARKRWASLSMACVPTAAMALSSKGLAIRICMTGRVCWTQEDNFAISFLEVRSDGDTMRHITVTTTLIEHSVVTNSKKRRVIETCGITTAAT